MKELALQPVELGYYLIDLKRKNGSSITNLYRAQIYKLKVLYTSEIAKFEQEFPAVNKRFVFLPER